MYNIKKSLEVTDGKLYTIQGANRYLAANCNAKIEIREHSYKVPILGKGNIISERDTVLLITFEHVPEIRDIFDVDSFQFNGKITRSDGNTEDITLNNCLLLDDLDLTAEGTCSFEVACSRNMLEKLIHI